MKAHLKKIHEYETQVKVIDYYTCINSTGDLWNTYIICNVGCVGIRICYDENTMDNNDLFIYIRKGVGLSVTTYGGFTIVLCICYNY